MEAKGPQHPDIDTGWAFLVALAAGLCHFLVLGFAMAFSAYYVIFLQVFGQSAGLTSWISSINYGMLCAVGPIASLIIKYYGCRITVFTGGLLSAAGLIASAFAQNVLTLVLTFGVISGTGYGLTFTGCIVVMSEYFVRFRVFTIGLSLAGGGLGNIVFPWILGPLLSAYDWRSALVITGAITFHICAMSLIMRPISTGCMHLPELYPEKEELLTWSEKLSEGLGMSLFSHTAFWLVCINTLLYCFSMSVLYTHISNFALEIGLDLNERNMLLSCLGFSGLLGRLVLGGIALLPWINTPLLFSACYVLSGMSVVFIAVRTSFIELCIFCTLYALFAAGYGPLLSEVTYMICGQENFATGYGWVMAFMAVGQILGAPAAGLLYDWTRYYPGSFYLAGTSLIISGITILPYAIQQMRWYSNRQAHSGTLSVSADNNSDGTCPL